MHKMVDVNSDAIEKSLLNYIETCAPKSHEGSGKFNWNTAAAASGRKGRGRPKKKK